jgi:hypothetical protein
VAEKQRGGGLPGSPEAGERSLIVAAYRQHSRQAGIEMPVGDAGAGARERPERHSNRTAGYGNRSHADTITAFANFMQVSMHGGNAPRN